MTFRELPRRIGAAVAGFTAAGVTTDSVVALVLPNCLEFIVAFQAVAALGATLTTVNCMYTPSELHHQLADARATHVVTCPVLLPLVRAAVGHGATPLPVAPPFVVGEASGRFLEEGDAPLDVVPVDAGTKTVVIPYSSGTTGLPKGVRLSHRNLVANVLQITGHATHNTSCGDGHVALGACAPGD